MNDVSIPTGGGLAKAESWLSSVADDIEGVWDQEALVYLRSRARDCDDQVIALAQTWNVAEQTRLEEYNQRVGKTQQAKVTATDIVDVPPMLLPGFWDGAPPEDYSFEATMLRTVEWCRIAGFEPWWRRLARWREEILFKGGVEESAHAAYWLFSMVRSAYAIELMPRVLNGYLASISLSDRKERQPWVFENGQEQHIPYASAIIFAHHRLTSDKFEPEVVHQAVETISKFQNHNGAWRTLTTDTDASIESTAMALHALALAQPPGWPHMAASARDWLWSVQETDGSWSEPGTPGGVYLTVLVLDAIALANGEKTLTFRWPPSPRETAQAHGLSGNHGDVSVVQAAVGIKPQRPRTGLNVTKWEDIEISFLSDERVQIRGGDDVETCNYAELGFDDGRNQKPRRAWTLLRILAKSDGIISDTQKTHGTWATVEKGIQEIRKLLRQYFGISSDPLPFADGSGYRARFRILLARSYET